MIGRNKFLRWQKPLNNRTKSNNGMHPTRFSMNVIENLAIAELSARRVMPGVRFPKCGELGTLLGRFQRMKALPEEITASAFTAANGEYAWPRAQIVKALQIIIETKQAILGGEVWAVKDGKIWGMILNAAGETTGV